MTSSSRSPDVSLPDVVATRPGLRHSIALTRQVMARSRAKSSASGSGVDASLSSWSPACHMPAITVPLTDPGLGRPCRPMSTAVRLAHEEPMTLISGVGTWGEHRHGRRAVSGLKQARAALTSVPAATAAALSASAVAAVPTLGGIVPRIPRGDANHAIVLGTPSKTVDRGLGGSRGPGSGRLTVGSRIVFDTGARGGSAAESLPVTPPRSPIVHHWQALPQLASTWLPSSLSTSTTVTAAGASVSHSPPTSIALEKGGDAMSVTSTNPTSSTARSTLLGRVEVDVERPASQRPLRPAPPTVTIWAGPVSTDAHSISMTTQAPNRALGTHASVGGGSVSVGYMGVTPPGSQAERKARVLALGRKGGGGPTL